MKKKTIMPRGWRNHNPLNIRCNEHSTWVGQNGNDGAFCVFTSMEYGYRAAFRLLKVYATKYQLYSPCQIIPRWAPESDGNNTVAYIRSVCNWVHLSPDDALAFGSKVEKEADLCIEFVRAMASVENGMSPERIDRKVIERGYQLAFHLY